MSLIDSAASGNRGEALRSLRDLLASTIADAASARDVAALSRQLTDVLQQIEAIEASAPAQKGTALDEFTKRRAARNSGAAGATGS